MLKSQFENNALTIFLEGKIDSLSAPGLEEEINRYELTSPTSPEMSIIRNYIESLANLPWNKITTDNQDISDNAIYTL